MHGLDIRSGPRPPDRTTQRQLEDVCAYAHWVWPSLSRPLTIHWSESLVLALDGDVPWIFGPAECDPLRPPSGGTVLPRRTRARLKRFAALGVPFQRVAIAHELNPDGPVRALIPALRAKPRACSEQVARRLVGDVPAQHWVASAVRILDAAVNGATGAARTPANLVSKVLDPIIFGIVSPTPVRDGDLCLWYPLAAWRW